MPQATRYPSRTRSRLNAAGLTLVEMLIVVALVGILATLAMPHFRHSIIKSKEAVLKEDLWILRDLIDQFYSDKQRYPTDLDELVGSGYLRRVPVDPMTGLDDWELKYETLAPDEEATTQDLEDGGITDIASSASGQALDGSYYYEW